MAGAEQRRLVAVEEPAPQVDRLEVVVAPRQELADLGG